jgi:hypothetical protein
MTVEITFGGSLQLTLVAEAVLGSLEAFFATAIDERVIPHTEKFRINLIESTEAVKPKIRTKALDMTATLTWPAALSLTNSQQQHDIRKFLAEVSGHVLGTTCMIDDAAAFLRKLYDDEAVHHRMAMIPAAANSYHRVASRSMSRLSDWENVVRRKYPPQGPRPQLTIVKLKVPDSENGDDEIESHRALRIRSVIDVHAWDQARWVGTLYLQVGPIPGIGFMFENREAGRKIFERWRERFGDCDANEEICLAIVRHLPGRNPHHYIVLITSRLPEPGERDPTQLIVVANRSMTMTPDSPTNLQRFLDAFHQFGAFCIMPAVIVNGVPDMMKDVAILKRAISVKDAANVGEHDIEAMALRRRKILPDSNDRSPPD